jgi:hypothetical protein
MEGKKRNREATYLQEILKVMSGESFHH